MDLVYIFCYDGSMDEDQITPDQLEMNLKKAVDEEQERVTAADNFYKNRRSQLANQMAQEFFGTDRSYSTQLSVLKDEIVILNQAIVWAKDQTPNALSVGYQLYALSAYSENVNLDKAIADWLDSLKSKSQKSVEDFIFGKKKPPKIALARQNQKMFESQDWPLITRVYVEEVLWREILIRKSEDALLALRGSYLKESFFPSQPNKILLDQLKKRLETYQGRLSHHREFLQGISQGRWNQAEVEEEARKLAKEDLEREEEEKNKQPQPTGGEVKINLEKTSVTPVSVGVGRNRVRPEGDFSWADWLRHPLSTFQDWWGNKKISSGINQLSGLGKTNVLRGVGKVNVLSGIEQTVTTNKNFWSGVKNLQYAPGRIAGGLWFQAKGLFIKGGVKKAVVGTAAKGLATKGVATLAGGAATGGVGWVVGAALMLKNYLLNPEMRNMLKDLATKGLIFASAAIYFLWANLPGLILGSAGAFLAAPFGVGAMATSFGAGFAIGVGLQKIAAGLFSGGGTSITSSLSAVPAAPVIPATISIGGFTLPAGLSAAASSFGALLSGSGLSTIALFGVGGGIGLVSLFTALTIITIGATQSPEQPPVTNPENTGAIISVIDRADKTTIPSGASSNITYTVSITSVGNSDADISVSMTEKVGEKILPNPSYNGSLPNKISKGEKIVLVFNPYEINGISNTSVINKVSVTAKAENIEETQSDSVTVTVGTPTYTGSCSLAPANTPCAVSEMLSYFENDQIIAEKASRICLAESKNNPDNINNSCIKNLSPEKMREYSVGLFQINLWAHDGRDDKNGLCKRVLGGQTPFRKPYYAKCKYPDCTPCDRDEYLLKQCADIWIRQENNKSEAAVLSKQGTNWGAWSTAAPRSATCPTCCGIQ